MKRITTIAMCLLASLAAVGSASAQDHQAKATVPFDFYVGNTWLPAGTYMMTSDVSNPAIINILSADKKNDVLAMAQPDEKRPGTSELVFRKHGDQYFLHEILSASGHMNVALPISKQEKRAESREATTAQPSDVYLAMLTK